MAMKTYTHPAMAPVAPYATVQSRPIPGRAVDMHKNRAGGHVFTIDPFQQLDRFLILGTEGGTYYATEREMTLENAKVAEKCVALDGERVVRRIVEISDEGRALKNEPAIYALAIAMKKGDVATRRAAALALPKVCRTATHLFDFMCAIKSLGGVSRVVRRAISNWYAQDSDKLAYQLVKYQNRNGWSHKDVTWMGHVHPSGPSAHLLSWLHDGYDAASPYGIVEAFEHAKRAETASEIVHLIQRYNLPREAIPTTFLNEPRVWEALIHKMPVTATLRNLGKITSIGLMSGELETLIATRISSAEKLTKGRVHPMSVLLALKVYENGGGYRGKLNWAPNARINSALDAGFYAAFKGLDRLEERLLVGVDVSGSMQGGRVAEHFTPAEAAAVIAMTVMRTAPNSKVIGYTTYPVELEISTDMRLADVLREVTRGGGGTDCAVPLRYVRGLNSARKGYGYDSIGRAAENRGVQDFDAVVVLTDNETWAGESHAMQELVAYREALGKNVKLITGAFTATRGSIADAANDPGVLDFVGLDANVPKVITEFVRS